ncbi:MAG: DUF1501 domain-containing protein [Burkholderiaceae bacterium]|nr:DUF1501 domain-containing protein [Burkholderiaceae bacterium]
MTESTSRRSFLRALSSLAACPAAVPKRSLLLGTQLAGLAALAQQTSRAADLSGGYKALVCVFLNGGSDTHNWVVPTDAEGYSAYAKARADLAWPLSRLQPITVTSQSSGRSFAMPLELAPLAKWYDAGRAAIVANIGTLERPITKADYQAGTGLPRKLFSHNDQASTWQSLSPEGARSGWGGRMGDLLMSANAHPVFTAVSANGNAVFLAGQQVTQFQVGVDGPVSVSSLTAPSVFGASRAPAALSRMLNPISNDPLLSEYARILQRGLGANGLLQTSLSGTAVAPIPATSVPSGSSITTLDKTSLARQLRMVLQMIAANQTLGMKRQVFMVSMGGFDTHASQVIDQPGHMAQVAGAIDYFLTSLATLGLMNNVTLFTASDFGRTLVSNGDGSDHGWGSHHFVAGGAVRGRTMHGRFPDLASGSPDDIGSGRLLPSTSVAQLAASLGGWMGLTASEQLQVLPNMANFSDRLALS